MFLWLPHMTGFFSRCWMLNLFSSSLSVSNTITDQIHFSLIRFDLPCTWQWLMLQNLTLTQGTYDPFSPHSLKYSIVKWLVSYNYTPVACTPIAMTKAADELYNYTYSPSRMVAYHWIWFHSPLHHLFKWAASWNLTQARSAAELPWPARIITRWPMLSSMLYLHMELFQWNFVVLWVRVLAKQKQKYFISMV